MKNLTFSLYSLPNTVFTTREIALILRWDDLDKIKSKINYYVKKGVLKKLRRGLFAKSNGYEILEASNKIFTPSYISLETVLQKEGVTFQNYDRTIFVISYQTREIVLDGFTIVFKKIKDEILTNLEGINTENGYSIAGKERAFLDALYLYKDYYFDNLDNIDFEKAEKILPIYNSRAVEARFKKYVKYRFS
jgi:hypothetical protein